MLLLNYFSVCQKDYTNRTPVTTWKILQPGTNQVAAGYVTYGTSTMIVILQVTV
jgi:fructose-1,6-bisphosphatase